MAGRSIFISYRREDSEGEAGRLAEHLQRRFGADRVFLDVDTIAPGTDFVDALDRALNNTAVVLVVIGRQWLSVTNSDGSRRLDDPNDFVRREIETALGHGRRVIPILVQNAKMPSAAVLPAPLAALASRQAMAIQHEEFSDDAQRLADAIAPLLGVATDRSATALPVRSKIGIIAGLAVATALVLALVVVRGRGVSVMQTVTPVADSAARQRQRTADDLVKVAADQRQRRQYADAMTMLDSAVALDANNATANASREELAMEWIRELKVTEGQTFSDAMVRPLAVLDRAAPFAHSARQGDLLAHIGWAMFLRWRDGDRALRPVEAYQRALAVDSLNPFANVFLGHWILSYDDGADALDRARPHFRIAADAGRASEHVRRIQLAALKNDGSVASRLESIRVMNEMRVRQQPLPSGSANFAWNIYYLALNGQASLTVPELMQVLPPAEHLLTYRWAFADYTKDDSGKGRQFRLYLALFQSELGQTAAAADSLRVLKSELGNNSSMLLDAVNAALKTRPPRRG